MTNSITLLLHHFVGYWRDLNHTPLLVTVQYVTAVCLISVCLTRQHVTLRAVDCVAECFKAARMHTSTKL